MKPRNFALPRRALALALGLGLTLWALPAAAREPLPDRLVPLGRAVGIKLFSDGVLVVGLEGEDSPARAMGLRTGDVICSVNARQVDSAEHMEQLLATLAGRQLTLGVDRAGEQLTLTGALPDTGLLGAWIRDSMAGIGTMTFYDPDTGTFGALGHGINDVDTAQLMPLARGSILRASVSSVVPGQRGEPGQLRGSFEPEEDAGALYANTGAGIFGRLDPADPLAAGPGMEVARPDQVRTGPATIRSTVAGDRVEEYEVDICRIYPHRSGERRNLMLRVTDPALLARTGGIVQGMSGSPIIQDGKLIGAVTHVLVDDPTRGYGIFIENMLEAAS